MAVPKMRDGSAKGERIRAEPVSDARARQRGLCACARAETLAANCGRLGAERPYDDGAVQATNRKVPALPEPLRWCYFHSQA